MPLKTYLLFLFLFALQASRIKGVDNHDVLSRVSRTHVNGFQRMSKQTVNVEKTFDLGRPRTKRSTVSDTGVKVCSEESAGEVLAGHQAYFKLRVCQVSVWEAFRVFLDRVPSSTEYDTWVSTCQRESLCMTDLLRSFSASQEHMDVVRKRLNVLDEIEQERSNELDAEKENDAAANEKLTVDPCSAVISGQALGEESTFLHTLPDQAIEEVVEFSVTVVDPGFSELLNDTNNPQYSDFTHSLHSKMLHVFDKLPGFKEFRVLGFRAGGISVRYAIVFETGTVDAGEAGDGSAETAEERGEPDSGDMVTSHLKQIVTKALSEEKTLPVDVDSICFHPESVSESAPTVTPKISNDLPIPNEHSEWGLTTEKPAASSEEQQTNILPPLVERENDLESFLDATMIKEDDVEQKGLETTTTPKIQHTKLVQPGSNNNDYDHRPDHDVFHQGLSTSPSRDVWPGLYEKVPVSVTNSDIFLSTAPSLEAFTASDATKASNSRVPLTSSTTSTWSSSGVTTEQQAMDSMDKGIPNKPALPQVEETTREIILTPFATTEPAANHGSFTTQDSAITALLKEAVEVPGNATKFPSEVKDVTPAPSPTEAHGKETHTEGPPTQTLPHLPKDGDTMGFQRKYPAETDQPMEGDVFTHDSPFTTARQDKELVVFFSLRVTNMMFTSDLFNKSSPEYRSLKNTFLEVLLPYLQSNLTGFKELEILNFRNGSIVVNSKMKFADSVPYNITEAVHCVLQDFCNAASKRFEIEIDSRSLDIEPADQADPCRFTDCNEFSRCVVNRWSQEPECLCDPGYITVNGLPCQSVCALEPGYCLNGGQCEIVPGHGAACRCPVGKYWHFHGERCTELVSMPVDPFLFVICFVGFLLFVLAVIGLLLLINRKCIRTRKTVTLVHARSPFSFGNTMRVNPVFESDDSTLTHVSSLNYSSSLGTSSCRFSERDTLDSIENAHLSIEIPRQLYTTRPDKLVSEMIDFHHCIPYHKWRLPREYRTSCCLLRTADNECSEVTVL